MEDLIIILGFLGLIYIVVVLIGYAFSSRFRAWFRHRCRESEKALEELRRERKARRSSGRYPTDKQFENFYRTGNRRYLYDENYKE